MLLAALLAAGLLTAATPAHAAESYFCSNGTQPYVPVATVESFDVGEPVTGLSVTHGTSPDGFTGTYVGFIADALGKDKDLLLFRLSSPVIDGTESSGGLKGAGIWAGMSGSPVYDKAGRLIGAVAYSLNTENLPIAGVTPAEYMKSIGTTAISSTAKVRATTSNLKLSTAGIKAAGTNLVGSSFAQVRTVNVAGTAGAEANAFTNRTLARTPGSSATASFLRSKNFLPAGSVNPASVNQALVAGGTITATYTDGDYLVGAIGTVTAICGDTVWAFGHPMDYSGTASMLLANASTAMIVPDGTGLYGSYKQVSEFGSPLGMITQDRGVGIRGTIGAVSTFPVDVAVQNATGTQVATYHVGVADPLAAAATVAGTVGTAAYEQLDQYGAGTGAVTWTIGYRRADGTTGSLTNSQVTANSSSFPDVIGTRPAADVWAITSNKFEDVTITSIQITLKLQNADAIAYKAADVQVLIKGSWKSLAGRRLNAGSSYSIRPQYRITKNDRLSGLTAGDPLTLKLKPSARKSGWVKLAATNIDDPCSVDSTSAIDCTDWSTGASDTASSFDEVLDSLTATQPDNLILGSTYYRLKKGSTTRNFTWTAPGAVTGSTKASFSIHA